MPPTFWLSFHAGYACRHTGRCCSSGWDIPIERDRINRVESAIAAGRVGAPAHWYRRVEAAPQEVAGVLALDAAHHCVFHYHDSCAIQSTLGHAAIPSACQHFPRIAFIDCRGVSVTLSHYCPTAANLLLQGDLPVAIVEGPPAVPGLDIPEGLDARDGLPPCHSPARLMDWHDYWRWERDAIQTLTGGLQPDDALHAIDRRVFDVDAQTLYDAACASVPAPHCWDPRSPFAPSELPRDKPALPPTLVGRFLAAHLFGTWMAYQGNGLLATTLYLRTALTVLRAELAGNPSFLEAIRQSDLLLRHLVDREELATRLSRIAAR